VAVNPFTPDFGRRPAHLVGQESLLASIERDLQTGPEAIGYTRLFLGHRGSGKTTLMAEIGDVARSRGMMVIDADAATPGLPDRIVTAVAEVMSEHPAITDEWRKRAARRAEPARMTGVGVGPLQASWDKSGDVRQAPDLRYTLMRVVEAADAVGSSVLLTLDELHAGDRHELRRVAADCQYITKIKLMPMAFMGGGLRELEYTMLRDKKMTFFHRCHREDIRGMHAADAWGGLRRYLVDVGIESDDVALRRMADSLTGKTFYHLQSLGDKAWRIAMASNGRIDGPAADEAVRQHTADIQRKILAPLWGDLMEFDQDVLTMLARMGGEASRGAVASRARDAGFRSKPMRESLARLKALDLVSEHNGRYAMSGLLDASNVLSDELGGALDGVWDELEAPQARGGGAKPRCGHYMPVSTAVCVLAQGHKGGHPSRL